MDVIGAIAALAVVIAVVIVVVITVFGIFFSATRRAFAATATAILS